MTVKELAKIAGVSPATISLVLNDKKGVGEETRKRVLEVLKKSNYAGHRKEAPATNNICFFKYKKHGMLVEQNEGFISEILDSIEAQCRLRGYNLSIVVSNNNFEETLGKMDFSAFDGLIMLGTELEEKECRLLGKLTKPLVVVDNAVENFPYNSVAINNARTVHCALSYLKQLGYRDVAYFHSSVSIANFEERCSAFVDFCKRNELAFDPKHKFELPPTLVGAYEAMKEALSSHPELPGCAFADNDSIAIGAVKALREQGYRVPEDVSVIGFDDIHFSVINSPPLTTMRIPKALIGALAVRQICDMIEHSAYSDVKLRVGGELVLRKSTVPNSSN